MTVFVAVLNLVNLKQDRKINGFLRVVSFLSELTVMREKEQAPQNNLINRHLRHLILLYYLGWMQQQIIILFKNHSEKKNCLIKAYQSTYMKDKISDV